MASEKPTKGAVRTRFRDDQLLCDLRRVARDLRRTHITVASYSQHGRYSSYTLVDRFGTWALALERAGLARLYFHVGRRELMLNLHMLWRQLGRFPQAVDINSRTSAFSVNAHLRRFETWGKLKTAFAEWMLSGEGQSDIRRFRAARQRWLRRQRARPARPRSGSGNAGTAKSASGASACGQPIVDAASIAVLRQMAAESHLRRLRESQARLAQRRARSNASRRRAYRRTGRLDLGPGLRLRVLQRDGFRCVLCGNSPATDRHIRLHIDHSKPLAASGSNALNNLQTLCQECNIGKGAKRVRV